MDIVTPEEYRRLHLPRILRVKGNAEGFRWDVRRADLLDAADEIDRLRSELEAERAYSANLREEMRAAVQANVIEKQVYGRD